MLRVKNGLETEENERMVQEGKYVRKEDSEAKYILAEEFSGYIFLFSLSLESPKECRVRLSIR